MWLYLCELGYSNPTVQVGILASSGAFLQLSSQSLINPLNASWKAGMTLSALHLQQPVRWSEESLRSKSIQGSQGAQPQKPQVWICSSYGLMLFVSIPSISTNQSWGSQFQHKETRWNMNYFNHYWTTEKTL